MKETVERRVIRWKRAKGTTGKMGVVKSAERMRRIKRYEMRKDGRKGRKEK